MHIGILTQRNALIVQGFEPKKLFLSKDFEKVIEEHLEKEPHWKQNYSAVKMFNTFMGMEVKFVPGAEFINVQGAPHTFYRDPFAHFGYS